MINNHRKRYDSHNQDDFDKYQMNRRSWMATTACALASCFSTASAETQPIKKNNALTLFSKHLGWMNYEELAETTTQLGFDGVDLTVRPAGHVLPENVERDLPRATETIRKAGLDVTMITTQISDPNEPTTRTILKTASALGIPFYRIGSWRYHPKRDVIAQLEEWKPKLKALEALNQEYNLRAGYHNHSGRNYIGAPMWDIYELFKGLDREWIGCNYDAAHAVAEGGYGAWEINMRLLADRFKMCSVKDSEWVKGENGWRLTHPPVGEGMTPWPQILKMMKESGFSGPFSMHFEYEIPAQSQEEERKKLMECIKRDRSVFRKMMNDANIL
ncbi:MAG: sugar phosphate isomerase/epimerase [Candidatus Omnitrophota bacterium]|jgi:sugar phosphate isomerase/epimerase|nr:MAG: sugar phosphate isomerase/epimerase [Candidatus Omnitrophota bacterium]